MRAAICGHEAWSAGGRQHCGYGNSTNIEPIDSAARPRVTLIAFLVGLLYTALAVVLLRHGKAWVNPVFFILVFYLFNYPVRAFLLAEYPERFNGYAFNEFEILAGLAYATCYVLVFVGTYLLLLDRFRIRFDFAHLREGILDRRLFFVSAVLVLLSGAVTFGYEVSVGGAFSLGEGIEELRRPFWVNVAGLPFSLRWFAVCMGLLLWFKSRDRLAALATAALLALLVLEAILTTAKGVVAALLLLLLFLDNLLNGRVLRPSLAVAGTVVLVVFSTYSYYARYAGGIALGSLQDYGEFFSAFVAGDILQAIAEQLDRILDRGTYYLDALVLMSRTDVVPDGGHYALGSLVELWNLVPRAFAIVGEQYSFDRYVTHAVWGELAFSQVFIGRIGESYFVLGFAGLIYAALHAAVFAYVASWWPRLSGRLAGISLYAAILLGWLYQDASLTYQLKNLIAILLCYALAKAAARLSMGGRRSTVRPPIPT